MIKLSKMTIKDVDGVVEVENECFKTPWSANAFQAEIENELARYVVAKDGDLVVGYGGVWQVLDEGHITNIAVRKSHRGKNIGGEILSNLIEICKDKNINSMTLEVRVSNGAAISLYTNHGFKEVGIRPKYYDDFEDAIIMWLTF